MQLADKPQSEPIREGLPGLFESAFAHPFFDWRWTILDVALIAAAVYTLH